MWIRFVVIFCFAGSISLAKSLKCSHGIYFELTKENINESIQQFDEFPSYEFRNGLITTRNKHREPCKIPSDNCARFVLEDSDCQAIDNCFNLEVNATLHVKTSAWPSIIKPFL